MIEATDRHRQWVGWFISILLHLVLLIFGAAWLIHSVQFDVKSGQTSTEIEFTVAPTSATVASPAASPSPPAPVPSPVQATPVRLADIPVAPTPTVLPRPAVPKMAKTKPPQRVSNTNHAAAREASSASKGAILAQPDQLHNEPPEYPDESRLAHEEGVALLRVEVTADGTAKAVRVLRSSGFFRLDQAALSAVRHWRFHPATTAGIPTPSEADVPVRFQLE